MSEQGSRMQRYAIVGMKHRGAEALVASLPPDEPLLLIREPDNKFDPNAVQVWARGRHVGYVPKTQNAVLAKFIDDVGIPTDPKVLLGIAADSQTAAAQTDPAHGKAVPARLHVGSNTFPLIEIV